MSKKGTILVEKTEQLESQPFQVNRFLEVDAFITEDVLDPFPDPQFKEEGMYSLEEDTQFEHHVLLPKPVVKSKRKRTASIKKRESNGYDMSKALTKKKIAEEQQSAVMAPDIFQMEMKIEERNNDYDQAACFEPKNKIEEEDNDYERTAYFEPLYDPVIHCIEKIKKEKKKSVPSRATTKQVRKQLGNFFNPPQRPKELNRPIPEMTLSPKEEDFENAFMTERMMLGLWHSILIPSDYLVQKFNDLETLNMAGTVICEDYIMQDIVNWSNDSLIYSGWDNSSNRVCIKVSARADNRELIEELFNRKKLRQNNPHLLIPFAIGKLGTYHISVSKLYDVNLERMRRIFHFALTDSQIYKVMAQLISAVAEIHKLGFIHADLCPSNVLFKNAHLYQQGNHAMMNNIDILLTDYNSCLTMSDKEAYHVGMIQQASYRAPEVILGHRVDSRVDMWSVGILAIDLIYPGHWSLEEYDASDPVKAGEHLYRIDRNIYSMDWNMFTETFIDGNQLVYWSYQDYYKKRLKLNFPPYNDTEEELRELLRSLLQTNPKSRLSSEEASSRYPCRDNEALVAETLETLI